MWVLKEKLKALKHNLKFKILSLNLAAEKSKRWN